MKGDDFKYLVNDRTPHRIPNAQLKRYAEKMLDIADSLTNEALGLLINSFPDQCRRPALSKLKIYMGIGELVRSNVSYVRRAKVSKIGKIYIALKCIYFTSLTSLNEHGKQKG